MAFGAGKLPAPPRSMFTREALLASDWYAERLRAKQALDVALWTRHLGASGSAYAREQLARVSGPCYLAELVGTIGADPSCGAAFKLRADSSPLLIRSAQQREAD